MVSVVADGGPTEQKALYECSPGKIDYEGEPMFGNLVEINRGPARKLRSLQKDVWESLD